MGVGDHPHCSELTVTTIIRRTRRRQLAPLLPAIGAAVLLAVLAAWVLTIIWTKGGPQPVHEIVIAIPAPQVPAPAGRRA